MDAIKGKVKALKPLEPWQCRQMGSDTQQPFLLLLTGTLYHSILREHSRDPQALQGLMSQYTTQPCQG